MVNVMKGGGRAPPPSPAWANFIPMMECTTESRRCYSVLLITTVFASDPLRCSFPCHSALDLRQIRSRPWHNLVLNSFNSLSRISTVSIIHTGYKSQTSFVRLTETASPTPLPPPSPLHFLLPHFQLKIFMVHLCLLSNILQLRWRGIENENTL